MKENISIKMANYIIKNNFQSEHLCGLQAQKYCMEIIPHVKMLESNTVHEIPQDYCF